jgi:hypothetical protein
LKIEQGETQEKRNVQRQRRGQAGGEMTIQEIERECDNATVMKKETLR